jgi:hypothetical protein
MPRTLDADLLKCLDRANPNVCHFVEVNAPDVQKVLRRAEDQFLVTPPLVSQSPASTIAADPAGALTIKSTESTLYTVASDNAVGPAVWNGDQATGYRGLVWSVDRAFGRGVLKKFTARMKRVTTTPGQNVVDFSLQIYRVVAQPAPITLPGPTVPYIPTFAPLLPSPVVVRYADQIWGGALPADEADITFDLSPLRFEVGNSNVPPPSVDKTGELQTYLFIIRTSQGGARTSLASAFNWKASTSASRTSAGIGTFEDQEWLRTNANDPLGWQVTTRAQVPRATITIESFSATVQAVYAVTLASVPTAASTGRVVFERGTPPGTTATLELSTAGTGGPWTAVSHDDVVAVKQATYHVRATLNASANLRVAPRIMAMGVQFRTPIDVTAEANVETVEQAIEMPFCRAQIGEGRVTVVRTGRRDFADVASELAVKYATPKLEIDVMLGSRHPGVPRSKWLLVDRAFVNDRQPTPTSERFGLLGYLKTLKRKIPARAETINSLHTVTAASDVAVLVSPALPGTAPLGSEYAGKHYYIRVRSSTQTGVESGTTAEITSNSGQNQLNFTPGLQGVLAINDVIEVHSGQWAQPALTWIDQDPRDIWLEILTSYAGIPTERIGRADLGRASNAGLPPSVVDRAPGDVTTQNKLKVTLHVEEAQSADELIDQLSFIMGGATTEIAGQIVFRQIYPLRDANGNIVVPAETAAATFDARNTSNLDTPTGLEQRITQLACDYGVNTTQVSNDTPPANTANFVDADALAWHAEQAVDDLSVAAIPKEIARWCYNSEDEGEHLASMLAQQVVRAASTGLRVWQWSSIDAQPHLCVGDLVVVVTDQYTDYDPARKIDIRGPWAFPLVLVSVANSGRRFRGMMMGLTDAVQIRGGPGVLSPTKRDAAYSSLNNFRRISETATEITYGWDRGAQVKSVWVHDALWEAPPAVDPWPGEDDVPTSILPEGTDTYTAQKPLDGFQRFLQFEPRLADLTHGTIRRAVVEPVPPKVSGKLRAIVTNGTADLTFELAAGTSSFPVTIFFTEDNPDGTPFAEATMIAPGILTTADVPAFNDRALPQREVRRFYARIVDVTGAQFWAFASADRDALPRADVATVDFRPDPKLVISYDDDTDTVRVTVPGGKTKTYGALVGSGRVTYTVGDALDDTTVESAYTTDEVRSDYIVEAIGGGTTLEFFRGPLHGRKPAGISQGTVSIDANGVAGFSPDLPKIALSYKYSYNVGVAGSTTYPSDASTASGGTVRNLSGATTDTVNAVATLTFGQSIFITVVPFTGASGTGDQLQPIHMRGAYLTYSATKTTTLAGNGWAERSPATQFGINWTGGFYGLNPPLPPISAGIMYLMMPARLPAGVTLVSASFAVAWSTATTPLGVFNLAVYKNNVLENFNGASYGGGNQTVVVSLSSTLSSGDALTLFAQWDGSLSGVGPNADGAQANVGDVAITYTMPTPDKTL